MKPEILQELIKRLAHERPINIFLWGLSGAGKDTIANHIKYNHDNWLILRLASTVKRIICETQNIPYYRLETEKRLNPELRKMHNYVGRMLDKYKGTNNRLSQLMHYSAFDYENIKHPEKYNRIIIDIRSEEHVDTLLNNGWIGIFLTRYSNAEYRDATHHTEQNLFLNGTFPYLVLKFGLRVLVIDNEGIFETNHKELYNGIFKPDLTKNFPEQLTDCFEEVLQHIKTR